VREVICVRSRNCWHSKLCSCSRAPRQRTCAPWRQSPARDRSGLERISSRKGEPAAIHTVITGQLQISRSGTSVETATSGDTIGIVETLAGQSAEEHVTVVESGSVLCLERTALFDLLSARTDLLCGLFGMVQAATGTAASSCSSSIH
jgi:hypothetical protein